MDRGDGGLFLRLWPTEPLYSRRLGHGELRKIVSSNSSVLRILAVRDTAKSLEWFLKVNDPIAILAHRRFQKVLANLQQLGIVEKL